MQTKHKAVLVQEIISIFQPCAGKVFLDVTCGGGTHTKQLLDSDNSVKVYALEWDKRALDRLEELQESYKDRLTLLWGNFAHLYKIQKKYKLPFFDGIVADFGTSQDQIFDADGFSFMKDSFLDMRMSQGHYKTTAYDVVNFAEEVELQEILWRYGEEIKAKIIVRAIIDARKKKKIQTTFDLVKIIESVLYYDHRKKIHPATKTFQALRIFINKELDNIQALLPAAFSLLKAQGRLACISFHSLEDRLVKNFFKKKESECLASLVFDGLIIPQEEEINDNPASRSSKLRVLEKKIAEDV